jgi:hypothetical protein
MYITVGDQIIQSHELHLLQWRWRELELQDYYQQALRINNTQLHKINWASL